MNDYIKMAIAAIFFILISAVAIVFSKDGFSWKSLGFASMFVIFNFSFWILLPKVFDFIDDHFEQPHKYPKINCISHKVMKDGKVSTIHIMTDDGTRGYLNLLFEDDECIINSIHVDENYRNKKVGTTLMKEATLEIIGSDVHTLVLYVIKDSWMHNWYKRIGYVDTDSPCKEGYIMMKRVRFYHRPWLNPMR